MARIKPNLNLFSKYYKIENDQANIDLYFDTFAELVENSFGDDTVEKLNSTLFEKIEEAFSLIPSKFKLKLNIHIKDLGDYTEAESERIIKENIDLKVYSILRMNLKKKKTSFIMFIIGIFLLGGSYFIANLNAPQIINDIASIGGTVILWDAAGFYFLERNSNLYNARQYTHKLQMVDVLFERKD